METKFIIIFTLSIAILFLSGCGEVGHNFKEVLLGADKSTFAEDKGFCKTDRDCDPYCGLKCGNTEWIRINIEETDYQCPEAAPPHVNVCSCIDAVCVVDSYEILG